MGLVNEGKTSKDFVEYIKGKKVFIDWKYSIDDAGYIEPSKQSLLKHLRETKPLQIKYWYNPINPKNVFIEELQYWIVPTTDQILTRLSSQVSEIHKMLHEKSKPRYVKVGAIKSLTGWDSRKLEWARRNGIVESKKTTDGLLYDINSINENFIRKTS